jgi:integrase
MKADPKQKNLSWLGEYAYIRKKMPDGSVHKKSLGRLAPDDARRIVKQLVQKMSAEELQIKLGLIARRTTAATIGEIIQAYDEYTAGIEIDPETVIGVKRALLRILRTVKSETFDALGARSDLLNEALVLDYSAAMIAARKEKGQAETWDQERLEHELGKVQRTIHSTVQQARSMFSVDARKSKPYRRLELPDLTSFLEARVGSSTLIAYRPPAAEILEKIRQGVPALKLSDPAAWLAMQLEVNAGLRRGSAALAKWDWFVERGGEEVDLDVRVAKGGKSLVRFDWALYQEMKALRQDLGEYIVPGLDPAKLQQLPELERAAADHDARQEVFDRLLAWLRACGLDNETCRKPNHELRKWFGDQKFTQHGAAESQNSLGHSTPNLTTTAYSSRRSVKSLRVL